MFSYKTDGNLAHCLRNEVVKHNQITSDIKTYEIEGITNIDHIIPNALNLTLTKLIMDIKTEEGNSFIITTNSNW